MAGPARAVGGTRIFGKYASFDIVLGIILGSVLSRAITANAPFFPTIAAATALVALHRALAHLACYTDWLGFLIKGREQLLVEGGRLYTKGMRRSAVTTRDIQEAMRVAGNDCRIEDLAAAYLERNGEISIMTGTSPRDSGGQADDQASRLKEDRS